MNEHVRAALTPHAALAQAQAAATASLQKLRAEARDVSQVLATKYAELPAAQETSRWFVASTLAELESDHAYAALRAIAFEPLPAIAQSSHHLDPGLQNEVIVRMVTIDGLAALAKHGNERAEADLWDMASATEHAVPEALRAVAVKGYLASGDDYAAREQRLTRSLPKGLHWAVTLERPTAQDVNDLGQRVASALPPVDMRPNEAIEPQEQPLN